MGVGSQISEVYGVNWLFQLEAGPDRRRCSVVSVGDWCSAVGISAWLCGVEGVQSMDSRGRVPGAVGFDDRGGRSRWWGEVVRLS